MYERFHPPYTRGSLGIELMFLFPKLNENLVEETTSRLLRMGELKPNEGGWSDVGESWTIDYDSFQVFRNKVKKYREEVKRKLDKEILEAIKQLKKEIQELREELPKIISEKVKELQERERVKIGS